MRKLVALTFVSTVIGLMGVSASSAHLVTKPKSGETKATLASQTENLKHARYVCNHGSWLYSSTPWHCTWIHILKKEIKETKLKLNPPFVAKPFNRYSVDSCLAEIIDRETAGTWDPTIYNYSGSGAYGLPQALPGSKMASAGPDWRTNPWTQVRWMQGYVNARYGGSCGALAFHNANHWY